MDTPPVHPSLADLHDRLSGLMPRDRHRLRRRIEGAWKVRRPEKRRSILEAIAADIDTARQRVEHRRAGVPTVSYPQSLPVTQRKDDLLAAIRDNQVVIVAGETGSGKTTQLPKICLELGRGVLGTVGHTQPRRLAARTVAQRVADELDTPLGHAVGYKVRFTEQAEETTLVKLMTDGILLAEIQHDRMLRQYDTLIIDEAHERSLNVDFLLGYLKQLLPRRPDLKVIITSATIDPDRFSRHFDDAPVIEVSGRTYPVEVRYRPLVQETSPTEEDDGEDTAVSGASVERDQTQAIRDAVNELRAEGPGDILVFLSGEREIRDAAEALTGPELSDTEILPLYARLSAAEQNRVFQPHSGRRIVLATNVAETSLTVPGIKYVIDTGTARISRYSSRTKVQRLPIERVSQASADQRKGRCGRVSEGICIRLYSEEDFLSRPAFTDPEILRTNLASVILQMTALGLGDVSAFPFIDPPDRRSVKDGVQLLQELGALEPKASDSRGGLTDIGRELAKLPIDPRLARMVLQARHNGCAHEVMVIAAALSIQDPRERPQDRWEAAAEKHGRFADKNSDFLSYLNLWNYLRDRQSELSNNQFRKLCKAEFLNYLRVREWQDIYGQLRQMVRPLGITLNSTPADPYRIHVSLLAGLLSHIGLKDPEKREYQGARNARFAVFPGSALFKKQPRWVMAAELVETSRLWGRTVARIEPEWIEPLAEHLVKRTYSEPHWEKKQGAVMAWERVTLYGVPIVAQRKVNYGRIDPALSRELFIRHALVEGDWDTDHAFFHDNRALLSEVEELEHRARRRDIVVDDETLFEFYDQRIGGDVVSADHFDSWWKRVRETDPDLLNFEKSMLVKTDAKRVSESDYPDTWRQGDVLLPLTYQFEPGTDADGVTAHIPLSVLNQVEAEDFEWQIPGLREELVTALIRSLPKAIRRHLVPAPDHASAVLRRVTPREELLLEALRRELSRMADVEIPPGSWQWDRVPEHLKITFRVMGKKNRTLGEDKDLDALKRHLKPKMQASLAAAAPGVEREGLRSWDFGALESSFERRQGGRRAKGYPALVDEGDSVAIRVFDTQAEQRGAMWRGTRRLLLLNIPSPMPAIRQNLSNQAKLTLSNSPHRDIAELLDDCLACAVDTLMADAGGPAWDEQTFTKLYDTVRANAGETAEAIVSEVERVLAEWHTADGRVRGTTSLALLPALTDIQNQLSELIYPGFVTATGARRLPHLRRYVRAVTARLDKLAQDPQRDRVNMQRVEHMRQAYENLRSSLPPGRRDEEDVTEIRWMLEELRVSCFAQTLGTAYPVSEQRITKAINQVT